MTTLGIDIGSSGTKGVAVSPSGTVLARAWKPHTTDSPQPGWYQQDAEGVWWAGLRHVASDLLSQLGGRSVDAIGVSGMGPCVLLTDEVGRPCRAAILYGIDGRAGDETVDLSRRLGEEVLVRRGGGRLSSQSVAPKLHWIRDHEPDVWAAGRRVFSTASWVVHRLTGEYVIDGYSAGQAGPPFDSLQADWDSEWALEVGRHLEWPRVLRADAVAGRVSREAAAATGLREGLPVTSGTQDSWAEAVSVGVRRAGDVMVMYGSTACVLALSSSRAVSHSVMTPPVDLNGLHAQAGATATSGFLASWVARLTGSDHPELLGQAEEVPPGSHGIIMLPYFAGERTPLYDPFARGLIAGLTLQHGPADLYRAALESAAFAIRHNVEAMADTETPLERLVAVGGGTRDTRLLWPRVVSSVLNRSQWLTRERVGAAYGNAVLAASAVGQDADIERWNPVVAEVAPDADWVAQYAERWPLYVRLHDETIETSHALAHLEDAVAEGPARSIRH